jgi:hypothetical protein
MTGYLQHIPEPAIRFAVMRAAAAAGKLSTGNDAQILLGLFVTVVSKVSYMLAGLRSYD